jgi:hypothetical protein
MVVDTTVNNKREFKDEAVGGEDLEEGAQKEKV